MPDIWYITFSNTSSWNKGIIVCLKIYSKYVLLCCSCSGLVATKRQASTRDNIDLVPICVTGGVSLTFREHSKIFSRNLCISEIVLVMRMSSWNLVRTKFQLEILTKNVISGVVYFREIILENSRNVSETTSRPQFVEDQAERLLFEFHDDVIEWKHFPRYWPFLRAIHRSPVNSPHKGQWHGALMFSLICTWINGWVNNREAGDLRRHNAHYDVTVMVLIDISFIVMRIKINVCVFRGVAYRQTR